MPAPVEEHQRPRLADVNADLDRKLGSVAPLSWFKAGLSSQQILDGLNGDAGAEFFARTFTRVRSYRSLMQNLADDQVQTAILGLIDRDPTGLSEAIREHCTGPWSTSRLANAMSSNTGDLLYNRMMNETEHGPEVVRELFNYPAGWQIMRRVANGSAGSLKQKMVLWANVRSPSVKEKESVSQIMPLARPVESQHLESAGGLKSDTEITQLLNHDSLEVRYGAISEFFSSDRKLERFFQYISSEENRGLVVRRMKENLPRTALAFFDVLATEPESDGGVRRLAKAITHEDGSKVIKALASDVETQEIIFTLYNAYREVPGDPPVKDLMGKRVMYHVLMSDDWQRGVEVLDAVGASRREAYRRGDFTLKEIYLGKFGDIFHPNPDMKQQQMDEVRQARS
ncbi:MAG: hypothetical protein ABIH11_08975 [Candidatus Altiarchaeota archaeon]